MKQEHRLQRTGDPCPSCGQLLYALDPPAEGGWRRWCREEQTLTMTTAEAAEALAELERDKSEDSIGFVSSVSYPMTLTRSTRTQSEAIGESDA